MKKYVCLRDDDTNFFTRIEDFEEGYGDLWGSVPITLATVPFSHGSQRKIMEFDLDPNKYSRVREWENSASAQELTEYHKVYPIGGNTKLVEALRKMINDGKIEIAQHGVFHRYNERGPEMFSNEIAYEAIRDGKEYLEKIFDTPIKTFVPPSNTIDELCVSYIKRLQMDLLCSGGVRKNNTNIPLPDYMGKIYRLERKLLKKTTVPLKEVNGVYHFGSITYNVFNEQKDIYMRVVKQLSETGFVALGTHYMLLADRKYSGLYCSLVHKLQDIDGVEFVTAHDYLTQLKKKYEE